MVVLLTLSGCTDYRPNPLTVETIQQQLQTPTNEQLTIQATKITHAMLKPLNFELQDGLSPDEAAILAVLRNPELHAIRDQHGIATAQLLQAGLLPNPQISYNFDAPSGGTDQGMINAFGIGLSWEATALIWRENKIIAAGKKQHSIDLHIAWQEWQIAQAAKLAVYQLIVYSKQQTLLNTMAQRLEDNRVRLQQATDMGLATELERMAAVSAKNRVDIRLLDLEKQKILQRQRLNRTMGLKPQKAVMLQQNIDLATRLSLPAYKDLVHDIGNRRLDLLALKRGYESQEERVHIAVLQQFPQISIGFNHARDNSNLYTLGFGVSITLPIFDRNQGQIAVARATRQQLFDQYSNRLFQARANIAELLDTIVSINKQIHAVAHAIPDLTNLVKAYQSAIKTGQVDVLNYYVTWNRLTDKKIDLLSRKLQLIQAGIALETVSGIYHIATNFHGQE